MFHAAFPSSRDRTEYPRLVVLIPDEPAEASVGNPEEQTPTRGVVLLRETWDRWMQLCNSGGRSFRLVFLCEHDLSEVSCGPEGNGYPIQDAASLFKTSKPLIQVTKDARRHEVTPCNELVFALDVLCATWYCPKPVPPSVFTDCRIGDDVHQCRVTGR